MVFVQLFISVVLSIFLMIGVGVALDRFTRLDIQSLTRLTFFALLPPMLFVTILKASISGGEMLKVGAFTLLHLVALAFLSWTLFSYSSLKKHRPLLTMAALFHNCGYYGIPMVALAFGHEYLGTLAIVIMVQNFFAVTYGVILFEKKSGFLALWWRILRLPPIIAIIVGLFCRGFLITPPSFIMQPVEYLANGLIPVALITLGAQLSRSAVRGAMYPLAAVTVVKLLFAPLLAAVMVLPLGFSAQTAGVLIVTAGLPVAVTVYILASEYEEDEALASQTVFWTTLFSAITIPLLIALCR